MNNLYMDVFTNWYMFIKMVLSIVIIVAITLFLQLWNVNFVLKHTVATVPVSKYCTGMKWYRREVIVKW